jgi:predicted enzyme related to lactoylglutathione lyase
MLQNSPPITFLATDDREASLVFFQSVLGLQLLHKEPDVLVWDLAGIILRMSVMPKVVPAPFTVLGWLVEDIRGSCRQLAERGVRFERYEQFEQDDLGIATFPGGTRVAWFKDPAGNLLSLTQT